MGMQKGIDIENFPLQGILGERVKVCFNYDTTKQIGGTVIRDDREEPFLTLFKLDDGRIVTATECMYSTGAPSLDPNYPQFQYKTK